MLPLVEVISEGESTLREVHLNPSNIVSMMEEPRGESFPEGLNPSQRYTRLSVSYGGGVIKNIIVVGSPEVISEKVTSFVRTGVGVRNRLLIG